MVSLSFWDVDIEAILMIEVLLDIFESKKALEHARLIDAIFVRCRTIDIEEEHRSLCIYTFPS